MTVAGRLAEGLAEQGVRYVFGIPGGPSLPYIEEFRRCGIEFILTSSETAAAVMADVTGRITGIPGVCLATFGPGAVNLASGIGGALLDRSPVIALTSEVPDAMRQRTCQMNIDHQALFRPLTKATWRISRSQAESAIRNACVLACREYPGPVHIGLPSDIAELDPGAEEVLEIPTEKLPGGNTKFELERVLRKAKSPVMAVGLTAARLSLGPALLEFLEKNPMPVVVTPMAKGLIPPGHPCYSGVLFHARSDLLKQVYRDSDLVIGFGYDPVEFNYESWMPDVPLVSINTVAVDLPAKAEALQFVGDLREGLQLADASLGRLSADSLDAARNAREEFRKAFVSSADGFSPVTALRVLREELPAETIMTADVGSHLHLLGQYWDPAGPGKLIMTNGWSSMGFGLPAAIAAQIQHPERPVVCLTGDGGILMCLGELATASRLRLPLTVVVFADRQLNLIGLKEGWRGTGNFASSLYEGDLFGADSILGVKVIRAVEAECLELAVRDALNNPGPVVIETVVDPSDYERLILPA